MPCASASVSRRVRSTNLESDKLGADPGPAASCTSSAGYLSSLNVGFLTLGITMPAPHKDIVQIEEHVCAVCGAALGM